jgi:hypothetical protein
MPEKKNSNSEQKGANFNRPKSVEDLEPRKDDANKVKGGRAVRLSEDPCAGGE